MACEWTTSDRATSVASRAAEHLMPTTVDERRKSSWPNSTTRIARRAPPPAATHRHRARTPTSYRTPACLLHVSTNLPSPPPLLYLCYSARTLTLTRVVTGWRKRRGWAALALRAVGINVTACAVVALIILDGGCVVLYKHTYIAPQTGESEQARRGQRRYHYLLWRQHGTISMLVATKRVENHKQREEKTWRVTWRAHNIKCSLYTFS